MTDTLYKAEIRPCKHGWTGMLVRDFRRNGKGMVVVTDVERTFHGAETELKMIVKKLGWKYNVEGK